MNKILDNLISLAGQYNNTLSYSMIARELEKHEEISPKDVKAIYGQLSNGGVNIVEYDEALDMVNLSDIKIEEEGPGEEDILALEAEQQGYADSDLDDIVKLYFKDMSKLELIDFSDENKLGERIYKAREAKEFVADVSKDKMAYAGFSFREHAEYITQLLKYEKYITDRRSEYNVCNTIVEKQAANLPIDYASETEELTSLENQHLIKLCSISGISIPQYRLKEFKEKESCITEIIFSAAVLKNKVETKEQQEIFEKIDGQIQALKKQIEEQGELAVNKLAQANLRLVVSMAKKFVCRKMSILDIIQEGNCGLLKAISKYDYTKGFKFSTYAMWWIRQSITRAIADQDRTIRVPVHMIDSINKFYRTYSKIVQELGHDPDVNYLANKMKLPVDKVEELLTLSLDTVSLDTPVGENQDSPLIDFIEDRVTSPPGERLNEESIKSELSRALNTLTNKEKVVLEMRYGLLDGSVHTLDEIGDVYGVTRERIRQIENSAIQKLAMPNRSKHLRELLC